MNPLWHSYVYCINDGFYIGSQDKFCVKGKKYKIIRIKGELFMIIDECGSGHFFSESDLINGTCIWFIRDLDFTPTKNIKNITEFI